jgi:Phage MuF-C-terminal domain
MHEQLNDTLVDWIQTEGSKGLIHPNRLDDRVVIGRFTQDMLKRLGCSDLELITSVSVLEKMMFDHGISANKLKTLHQTICMPQRVYRSASHPQTSVVVMTLQRLGAKPILIPIWLNKASAAGKPAMHWVASGYVKDDPNIFNKWDAAGLLIWSQSQD